jgi:hypothetical protein
MTLCAVGDLERPQRPHAPTGAPNSPLGRSRSGRASDPAVIPNGGCARGSCGFIWGEVIPGPDLARDDHAQVGSGRAAGGEPLHPLRLPHPVRERRARDARRGRLQHHGAADPPAFPRQRARQVQALGRQVLPELAGGQLVPQFPLPPVQVLAGVGVIDPLAASMPRRGQYSRAADTGAPRSPARTRREVLSQRPWLTASPAGRLIRVRFAMG